MICIRWFKTKLNWWRSKRLADKLLRLKKPEPKKELPPPKKTWLDRIQEKFPTFRYVSTQRGGLNMPKRRPCPVCGKWSKRRNKTLGGADYHCPSHGLFFVSA